MGSYAIDRSSDVPVGAQLSASLRSAIATGRLGAGERLPGLRDLAVEAGVNVNTVRAVYARLADEGLVVTQHGRGTFVARQVAGDRRRSLREQIASLEGNLGELERELRELERRPGAGETDGGRATGARVLSTRELESVRDDLAEQAGTRRAQLLQARERAGRQRGIADDAPQVLMGAGGWTLRWKA